MPAGTPPVPASKAKTAAAQKPAVRQSVSDADCVADEAAEQAKRDRLLKRIHRQSIIIAVLICLLMFGLPFFRPIFRYNAIDTGNTTTPLVALTMPNMTSHAITSWATTAVTEIMTMGFGDYLPHLKQQKNRFTASGWDSFSKAFDDDKIGEQFRKNQLVLTTAPCNTATIVKQGENEKHVYEWEVQMPVVMTYATNNNKTSRKNAVMDLTIVREPTSVSSAGIAIANWQVSRNASTSELCR